MRDTRTILHTRAWRTGATALLGVCGVIVFAMPSRAQLQYHTLLQFPQVSQQGESIPTPEAIWMPTPQTLLFSSTASGNSFWNWNGSVVNRIIRSSESLPGLSNGLTPLNSSIGWVAPNGDFWFMGRTGLSNQLWRKTGGGFSPVVAEGQAVPGVSGAVSTINAAVIGADGIGYVRANVTDVETTNYIWRVNGTSYQPILHSGQIVPGIGGALTSASVRRVLADGRTIVSVQTASTVGTAILPGNGVSTLATAGTVASLNGYQPQVVSSSGSMLVRSATEGTLARTDMSGQLAEIVHITGPVSGNVGWTMTGNPIGMAVSENGSALFGGRMGPAGNSRQTIAIATASGITPILRDGDALMGGNLNTIYGATDFNTRGQVAFEVDTLVAGVFQPAVFAWDPNSGPIRVAGPGDHVIIDGVSRTLLAAQLIQPDSQGGASFGGLDNSGRLTFWVSVSGGPSAIVTTQIPAPGTILLMTGVGVTPLLRRSRRIGEGRCLVRKQ